MYQNKYLRPPVIILYGVFYYYPSQKTYNKLSSVHGLQVLTVKERDHFSDALFNRDKIPGTLNNIPNFIIAYLFILGTVNIIAFCLFVVVVIIVVVVVIIIIIIIIIKS